MSSINSFLSQNIDAISTHTSLSPKNFVGISGLFLERNFYNNFLSSSLFDLGSLASTLPFCFDDFCFIIITIGYKFIKKGDFYYS